MSGAAVQHKCRELRSAGSAAQHEVIGCWYAVTSGIAAPRGFLGLSSRRDARTAAGFGVAGKAPFLE